MGASSDRLHHRVIRHEAFGQFVRYAVVGVINVALFLAIFNGLRSLGTNRIVADVIALTLTSIGSFFLNKRWAFRDVRREAVVRQYLMFAGFTIVGLGLQTGAFKIFLIPLERFGRLGENAALLAALPVSIAWNFLCYRTWTFKSQPVVAPGSGEA